MAYNEAKKTFDAVEAGTPIKCKSGSYQLIFGTGTMQFQTSMDGTNWYTEASHTSDIVQAFDFGGAVGYARLNCSAYTADITGILGGVE